MMVLSCYVVGAGMMGTTHLGCHTTNPNVKVLGVIDTDEKKGNDVAQRFQIKWYASLESAFRDQPADFCDVCLPSSLHKDAVVTALQLGAHVVCEKPFAVTSEDISIMMQAALQYDRRLMVAHVCRFMPQYFMAKNILDTGSVGKPISFVCKRESETPKWSWNNWLYDKQASGGTLLDLSIHDIDISNWFFGVPETFQGTMVESSDRRGVSVVSSSLSYPDGVQSTIVANHLLAEGHPFQTAFCLTCTKGSIEYDSELDKKHLRVYSDGVCELVGLTEQEGYLDAYAAELKDFVDSLIQGKPFRISMQEAALAVDSVWSLYRNMHSTVIA